MKERLEDALSIASKVIRIAFYLGTSTYLAAKTMVIISIKIAEEPSPRQLRSEREKAKKLESLLKFYKKDYK